MALKTTILITGSSGYLGKNIKELLQDKYSLLTPSRKELNILDSILVDKYFKTHKIDVVIHCAVNGGSRKEEEKESALQENLKMFFNITRNKKHFKKMIHFGSGAEYDKRFPIVKVNEKDFDKRIPIDDYGLFKYICSKYIESSDKIICLRVFGLFGKYEDYRYRFISNAICRNILGMPITLRQNAYFDYVYIKDFIKIIEWLIDNRPKHKFYNIGSGKKISLLEITKKIEKITNKKSEIKLKQRGLNKEYTCDNSLILKELKGFKFTNFDLSLQELYEWYKVNKLIIDKKSL